MVTEDELRQKYGISLVEARKLLPVWGKGKSDEQIIRLLDFITALCEKTINTIISVGDKV